MTDYHKTMTLHGLCELEGITLAVSTQLAEFIDGWRALMRLHEIEEVLDCRNQRIDIFWGDCHSFTLQTMAHDLMMLVERSDGFESLFRQREGVAFPNFISLSNWFMLCLRALLNLSSALRACCGVKTWVIIFPIDGGSARNYTRSIAHVNTPRRTVHHKQGAEEKPPRQKGHNDGQREGSL